MGDNITDTPNRSSELVLSLLIVINILNMIHKRKKIFFIQVFLIFRYISCHFFTKFCFQCHKNQQMLLTTVWAFTLTSKANSRLILESSFLSITAQRGVKWQLMTEALFYTIQAPALERFCSTTEVSRKKQ